MAEPYRPEIYASEEKTAEFMERHEIDFNSDADLISKAFKSIVHRAELVNPKDNPDFFRLDYICTPDLTDSYEEVPASRRIAELMDGQHTGLRYWSETAPANQLEVRSGIGALLLIQPDGQRMSAIPIGASEPDISRVNVPGGYYYLVEAAAGTPDNLVVSGIYDLTKSKWADMEFTVDADQMVIEAPEGSIAVPDKLRELYV